jgi:hypothetical protein
MRSEMSELTKRLAKAILPLRRKEELAAVNAARDHVAKDLSDHYSLKPFAYGRTGPSPTLKNPGGGAPFASQ